MEIEEGNNFASQVKKLHPLSHSKNIASKNCENNQISTSKSSEINKTSSKSSIEEEIVDNYFITPKKQSLLTNFLTSTCSLKKSDSEDVTPIRNKRKLIDKKSLSTPRRKYQKTNLKSRNSVSERKHDKTSKNSASTSKSNLKRKLSFSDQSIKLSPGIKRSPKKFFNKDEMPESLKKSTPKKQMTLMKNTKKKNIFDNHPQKNKIFNYLKPKLICNVDAGKNTDDSKRQNDLAKCSKTLNFEIKVKDEENIENVDIGCNSEISLGDTDSDVQIVEETQVDIIILSSQESCSMPNHSNISNVIEKRSNEKDQKHLISVTSRNNFLKFKEVKQNVKQTIEVLKDVNNVERIASQIDKNNVANFYNSQENIDLGNNFPKNTNYTSQSYFLDLISFLITFPLTKLYLNNSNFFTVEYKSHVKAFESLSQNDKRLYSKLFSRKTEWFRESKLNYNFIRNISESVENLEKLNFITCVDFDGEEINELLNFLNLEELKCVYQCFFKSKINNKQKMIKNLIEIVNSNSHQTFNLKMSSENKLRRSIKNKLREKYIKLTEGPKQFFNYLLILATYPHHSGTESDRLNDINQILMKSVNFPMFQCKPVQVFHTLQDLIDYTYAAKFSSKIFECIESKNWIVIAEKVPDSLNLLKKYLKENFNKLNSLPKYLLKFTPGYHYASVLNKSIVVLKKNNTENLTLASECLTELISQEFYLRKYRCSWYDELALIYQRRHKNIREAAKYLCKGMEQSNLDRIGHLALSGRAVSILKSKNHNLNEVTVETLKKLKIDFQDKFFTRNVDASTCMSAASGRKQVFINYSLDGVKEFCSVEEAAINFYKTRDDLNYKNGVHDEGKLIKNLALAFFWEIIYIQPFDNEKKEESVFHSNLQTVPLDWGGKQFYNNRKKQIKTRLKLITDNGIDFVMSEIERINENSQNVSSIIDPSKFDTPNKLIQQKELLSCLKMNVFAKICKHLLKDYKLNHSGFPDLTIWDSSKDIKQCLIVEVKGPNDKLSDAQRIWMDNLRIFGADVELCKVDSMYRRISKGIRLASKTINV